MERRPNAPQVPVVALAVSTRSSVRSLFLTLALWALAGCWQAGGSSIATGGSELNHQKVPTKFVAGGGHRGDEPRHACDPVGSTRKVTGPSHPPAVCGNGVIDTVWGECSEICTGGCDEPIRCRVDCASSPESCDGKATTYTCESQGYAGGTMGCTADCNLDLGGCLAVVPGASVRQGAVSLAGDTAFVIGDGHRAAVFAVDAASSALFGASLDASLRGRPFRSLPGQTLAVGAMGDRLGFVSDDRRFGTIDLTGAVAYHGDIGDANSPALILPEVGRTASAAVLVGDYQRRVLTVFDPSPVSPPEAVRMFALDNLRVVVVEGDHPLAASTHGKRLVVLRWGSTFAFSDSGERLDALPSVPNGFAFSETSETIDDVVTWSGGLRRFHYARGGMLYARPPGGLSRAAVAGASVVAAFGGTLFAHAEGEGPKRRVDLFWLPIADPLLATVSSE